MTISKKLNEKIKIYVAKLETFADRNWYPPLIAFLSAIDNFIVIIPNDGILIASSMLVPRRWALLAISIAIGSTSGALLLSALVELQGLPWILDFYPGINQTQMWIWSENFFKNYGLIVVFIIGATPIIQQPIIILAALAQTPLWKLTATFFAGRLLKFMLMAYLGSHSPKLLKKMWGLKDEMDEAGIKID